MRQNPRMNCSVILINVNGLPNSGSSALNGQMICRLTPTLYRTYPPSWLRLGTAARKDSVHNAGVPEILAGRIPLSAESCQVIMVNWKYRTVTLPGHSNSRWSCFSHGSNWCGCSTEIVEKRTSFRTGKWLYRRSPGEMSPNLMIKVSIATTKMTGSIGFLLNIYPLCSEYY